MTSVAKVEFGPVRRNHLSSATNNYIDEAQLQLCYFAPLPELCGRNCVAWKAPMMRVVQYTQSDSV